VATAYSVFAIPVVLHHFLRRNIMGFRWMLLGCAISGIITIFGFHNATEVYQYSGGAVTSSTTSDIMGGQLFGLSHFGMWPTLPTMGWYLSTPSVYAIISPLILTGYTVFSSASGRAAILNAILSSVLIFIGTKSRKRMKMLQTNLWYIFAFCIFIGLFVGMAYKFAGQKGWLNKDAQKKYEAQMEKSDNSFNPLKVIMAGRLEFFCGMYACLRSPIVGYGPWAIDNEGLYEEFLRKYGAPEDYDNYSRYQMDLMRYVGRRRVGLIPAHSYLIAFWLHFGILGLPYWLYVIYVVIQFFRHYVSIVPQFYGYLVLFAASFLWDVFFSPFAARMGFGLFLTIILLTRAIGTGRLPIPLQVEIEAQRYDKL